MPARAAQALLTRALAVGNTKGREWGKGGGKGRGGRFSVTIVFVLAGYILLTRISHLITSLVTQPTSDIEREKAGGTIERGLAQFKAEREEDCMPLPIAVYRPNEPISG